MASCRRCGTENGPDVLFCESCGSFMAFDAPAPLEAAGPATAELKGNPDPGPAVAETVPPPDRRPVEEAVPEPAPPVMAAHEVATDSPLDRPTDHGPRPGTPTEPDDAPPPVPAPMATPAPPPLPAPPMPIAALDLAAEQHEHAGAGPPSAPSARPRFGPPVEAPIARDGGLRRQSPAEPLPAPASFPPMPPTARPALPEQPASTAPTPRPAPTSAPATGELPEAVAPILPVAAPDSEPTRPAPVVPHPGPAVPPASPVAPVAEVRPTGPPPAPPAARPRGPSRERVLEAVRGVLAGADRLGRHDVAERLQRAEQRLAGSELTLVVVGEFKKGKSSLINALIGQDVCPVDEDTATVVPTIIRHGETPCAVMSIAASDADGVTETRTIDVPDVSNYVSERSNPRNRLGILHVEVAVPSSVLERGLTVIDTPGVGGLTALQARAALMSLDLADAVLFVTDASQELTAAEVDYLREVQRRCSTVLCALTKPDIAPAWEQILDIDRGHLLRHGVIATLTPVSSTLARLGQRRGDDALVRESGLSGLVASLERDVLAPGDAILAKGAAEDALFALDQLVDHVKTEIAASSDDAQAAAARMALESARERANQLRQDSARWQLTLQDGIQDLVASVKYDVGRRVQEVMVDAERAVKENDPAQIWEEFEPWLRQRVIDVAVDNHEYLRGRTSEVAKEVAALFGASASEVVGTSADLAQIALRATHRPTPTDRLLADTHLGSLTGRPVATALSATRAALGGTGIVTALVGGVARSIIPMVVGVTLAPVAAVASVGLGVKVFTDMRRADVAQRQARALSVAHKYVDDAGRVLANDAEESLRATQRQLRDQFNTFAKELESSVIANLASAEAARADIETARARLPELRRLSDQMVAVRGRVKELVAG